jgi:ABC-type multidrug transport system ATPase subunit
MLSFLLVLYPHLGALYMDNVEIILTKKRELSNDIFSSDIHDYQFILDYSDNWNDFGYHSLLNLTVVCDGKIKIDSEHFQGFHKDKNEDKDEKNWTMERFINETYQSDKIKLEALPREIVTFAPADLYRKLFSVLPNTIVKLYLKRVNDICFNNDIAEELFRNNDCPDFVTVSFFRPFFETTYRWSKYGNKTEIKTEEQQKLWQEECTQIISYLNILHSQLIDGFSDKLIFKLSSKELFKENLAAYDFDIELKNDTNLSPLPTNCFAIIGVNGIGKTTLFRNILTNFNFNHHENSVFSQIALISFDNNTRSLHKEDNDYRRVFIGTNSSQSEKENFKSLADNILCSLDKISFNTNREEGDLEKSITDAFNNFMFDETMNVVIKKMKNYLNLKKEVIKYGKDSVDSPSIEKNTEELRTVLLNMSSGQKMIFSILLSLSANILPKSMILIDEPENTLHPPFIMALIYSINTLAEKQDSMVILSTHSPIIVQELTRNNVLIMYKNNLNNSIGLKHPEIETFASSIDTLNDYIFGLDIRKSGHIKFLNNLRKAHPDLSLEEIRNHWKLSPHAMSYVVNGSNKDE